MLTRAATLVLLLALTPAVATGQKKGGLFRDPEDGQLDMSEWLLTKKGFLPIPIIITEPAFGGFGDGHYFCTFAVSTQSTSLSAFIAARFGFCGSGTWNSFEPLPTTETCPRRAHPLPKSR